MVSPLDNVRPVVPGQTAPSAGRSRGPDGAFDASLERALEAKSAQKPAPAAAVPADDIQAQIEQATESLRRANSHINAARAYFRGAEPPSPGSIDSRG